MKVGILICPECGKSFKSLGFARHRAMHYDKRIAAQKEESAVAAANIQSAAIAQIAADMEILAARQITDSTIIAGNTLYRWARQLRALQNR